MKSLFYFILISMFFTSFQPLILGDEKENSTQWWNELKKNIIPQAIKEADEETLKYVETTLEDWKSRIPKEIREEDKAVFIKEMKVITKAKILNNRLNKSIQSIKEYFLNRKGTKEESKYDEKRMALVIGLVLYSIAESEGGVIESYKSIKEEIKTLIANYEIDLEKAKTYANANPLDFAPIVDRLNNNIISSLQKALISIDQTIQLHEQARGQFIDQFLVLQRLVILTKDVNIEITESILKLAQESQKIAKGIVEIKF